MASFSATLHVNGQAFSVVRCTFETDQAIGQRGRIQAKVRYSPVQLALDVPPTDALLAWAADPHKQHAVDIVFLDTAGGQPLETLHLPAAYCVAYHEQFVSGDAATGAYQCTLMLSDPTGWTLEPGGPTGAFMAPAAGQHGASGAGAAVVPAAVSALRTVAIGGGPTAPRTLVDPADVPPHLPAPQPNPSPDHAQVHLTAAEWQAIVAGRWDDSRKAKSKRFLKEHRSTEFHVAGDPFTYRTDAKGKMVAVYDAQRSYNVTGSKNGLPGIPLTLTGEPTYAGTLHMFPITGNQKNVVQIEMAGNRPGDFKLANEAAGLTALVAAQGRAVNKPPEGYTWHHRDNFNPLPPPNPPYGTCTMELVEETAHENTFVHKGSCDQCNKHLKKLGQPKLYF